ncbi:MAG: glycosyltransferase [Candidatus Vogelbacteria bacterium]|nr:glycosyltransferase [Candidatus Vogelbacteria bacterium]
MKKICFFGIYDRSYSRNRVLISGFQKNNYEVIYCNIDPRKHKGIKKYWLLYKEYKKVKNKRFDLILVAYPGHTVVWLARLLFGGDIIFDLFLSLYNSEVEDRKRYEPKGVGALYCRFLDWYSCKIAKIILLDTYTQIDYFSEKFNIYHNRFKRVLIGSDDSFFHPKTVAKKESEFIVHFHGSFIPLHGIEYIIKAASILKNEISIKFRIFGKGQEFDRMLRIKESLSADNIVFGGRISDEVLNDTINEADIILGVFSDGIKSRMVVTNKVYEGVACRKPVLTARVPGVEEVFSDRVNILLCHPSDEKDLAKKILELKADKKLRDKIAENGYNFYLKNLRPEIIVSNLLKEI